MAKIDFQELIVAAVLPAVNAVAAQKIGEALDKVKDNNTPEVYEQGIRGLHAGLSLLATVTDKTKTKIDDKLVDGLLETVQTHGEENGITF